MDALIQDLLAYSRLSRDEVALSPIRVDQAIAEARTQTAADAQEQHAEINVEPSPAHVLANSVLLVQTLANLMSNAVKFVPPGTQPRVRIRAVPQGASTPIWVEDNGIGIDPKHPEKVFQIFERLHGTEYPGTGIGLAIVARAMARMRGTVGVVSIPGQGSRFWIELPSLDK